MEQQKPNILIIMTDQQRADLRKSRGYELDTMPFLDAWAAGGVDFDRAYTPNPTCAPARVSMFTGRYPSCHRVRTNENIQDACCTKDLLDILKENGYVTALCGKNHSHRRPEEFDFHECSGHLGNEGEENTTPEQKEFAAFLSASKHMESHVPSPGGVEVQHPYRNVSSALKFLDEERNGKPFFAWVSFAEPHNPNQAPKPYFDLFPPDDLPPVHGTKADLAQKGRQFVWMRSIWEQVLGADIEQRILRARSNYHGMLRLIDDQLKRLIQGLDARGLSEDTVVLFLSDHGDYVGEYDLLRKGAGLPDVLCRVPMIWKGPGIAPTGRCSDAFVGTADILPTLCDLIGAPVPFGCQGKSILPLLTQQNIPEREYDTAYAESGFSGLYWDENDALTVVEESACSPQMDRFNCLNSWTQCGQVRSLWKGDYRMELDMMGEGRLYCLRDDPYELVNLWDREELLPVKSELLAELSAAMMKAADPLPAPRRRYRVKVHPKGWWYDKAYHAADPGVRG